MNIGQALEIIEVSPEEVKSVERYIGFMNFAINMLCNMDVSHYKKYKGHRLMPKNKDEFEALINDFVNIYSVMIKLNSSHPKKLYRGSSDNHEQLVPNNSFISTSSSRNIAQSFMEKDNGAISTYFVSSGVPTLDVEDFKKRYLQDFISKDEIESMVDPYTDEQEYMIDPYVLENEYIVYPFTHATEKYFGKSRDGYGNYEITIDKQELEEVDSEELKRLSKEVIGGFESFIESLKEEVQLDEKARYFYYKWGKATDDLDYAKDNWDKYLEMKRDKTNQNDQYRNSVEKLIRGLCKSKELEISEADKVLHIESGKILQIKAENIRKEANVNLYKTYGKLIDEFKIVIENLNQNHDSITNIANKEKRMSSALGIEYDDGINRMQINQLFEHITQQIKRITDELAMRNSGQDISTDEVKDELISLNRFENVLKDVKGTFSALTNTSRQYEVESQDIVKEKLYNRVFDTLKSAKQVHYYNQLKNLQSQRPSLLDRITGKAKLRDEQIRQLNLKIQYENFTTPEKKQRYSIHDMIADIYYTSIVDLNGNMPPTMQDLIVRINSQFQERYVMPNGQIATRPFSPEQLLAKKMGQDYNRDRSLEVKQRGIRGLFAHRRAATTLQAQNNDLEQKVLQVRQRSFENRYDNALYNKVKASSIVRYHDALSYISRKLDTIDSKNQRTKEGELIKMEKM